VQPARRRRLSSPSTPRQRKKFWLDRSRTAAISRHTNAFKVNEDVVIPLPRMGDYCDGIERINIELSTQNKLALCDALAEFLKGELPLHRRRRQRRQGRADRRPPPGRARLRRAVRLRWQWLLDNLDLPLAEAESQFADYGVVAGELTNRLPTRRCSTACRITRCARRGSRSCGPPEQDFRRRVYRPIIERIEAIHKEVLRGRVFVALHMHAGDGNVHTNIPVNSDNYEMLQTANRASNASCTLARAGRRDFRRARHRHHQARIPDRRRNRPLPRLQAEGRPGRPLQPGKLMPGGDMGNAYTPSFSLLGTESLIMEQSEIGKISDMVKDCLRCGKCKPVCSTHVPRANLLYSPRNKILGTSLLVEAFLYEEQTRRGISLKHFDEFNDVADHCTVCHRCEKPCPVDIDFGDVSVKPCATSCASRARSASAPARRRRWPS
jgi:ferredoxin